MAKFNQKGVIPGKTTNAAGGVSYERSLKHEVASILLTSLMSGRDAFYESEQDGVERKEETLVRAADADPEFLARALVFARVEAGLRSIAHLGAVVLAEHSPRTGIVRRALSRLISRPDDMLEILALWNRRHFGSGGRSRMAPNSLRRAFRGVLEDGRFGEFHYSRYKGNSGIRLKDVVKMCHPSPVRAANGDLFSRVLNDSLAPARTMESARSMGESTLSVFSSLLRERKLGYMAAVKNIRSALVGGLSDDDFALWCDLISNPAAVRKSRILPFRFLDAYREVAEVADGFKANRAMVAFDAAIHASMGNMSLVEDGERIAVVVDDSGSMGSQDCSRNSTNYQIARLITGMILSTCGDRAVGYQFAETCRRINTSVGSILSWVDAESPYGGGTNVAAVFEMLTRTRTVVDKVILVTDLQLYDTASSWGPSRRQLGTYMGEYRKVSPHARLLFWSLVNNKGGTPIKLGGDIVEMSGLAERLLPMVGDLWSDGEAFIRRIESVEV